MAKSVFQRTIVTESGNVIPEAEIEVRVNDSGGDLADIYADRGGETSLANPFFADSEGFARFYATGGRYWVKATGGGESIEWEDVKLGNVQSRDTGTAPDEVPTNNDIIVTEDWTVRIPTDYSTLQEAIDETSRYQVTQGVTIDLLIESGHQPASGVDVRKGYYGHYTITSEDSEVSLAAGFSGDFLVGRGAVMPVLATLVDMNGEGGSGVVCNFGELEVTNGSGVKNAGIHGIETRASTVVANHTIWTGAAEIGIYAANGAATVYVAGADCSGAQGQDGCMYISRGCIVSADSIIANDAAGAAAIRVRRSRLFCQNAEIKNSAGIGIEAQQNSSISAESVVIENAGTDGIRATDASLVDANRATITGSGNDGVLAQYGGRVVVRGGTITNSGRRALTASSGSDIDAEDADCSGSGSNGCRAFASRISARDANFRVGAEDSSDDIIASEGSILSMSGATGGTNINTNELTSNGIIFR